MKRLFIAATLFIFPLLSLANTAHFYTDLTIGSNNYDVFRLQQFLNQNGFTVSSTGPGASGQETYFYGPATAAAVSRYQEAYASDILFPNNLRLGQDTSSAALEPT